MRAENKHPVPLNDCVDAYRWVASHAANLGVDPRRLYLAGDSAGGNLALSACMRFRDAVKGDDDFCGARPAGQVLVYPCVDGSMAQPSIRTCGSNKELLTAAKMKWFYDAYAGGTHGGVLHPAVSPLLAPSLAGLPATFVVVAEHDLLKDEGIALARRMCAEGTHVDLHGVPRVPHGFLSIRLLYPQEQNVTINRIAKWIAWRAAVDDA